jgi:hypothetical protein
METALGYLGIVAGEIALAGLLAFVLWAIRQGRDRAKLARRGFPLTRGRV